MNILASYTWLKDYLQTGISADEFARELSLKSMSVESIEHGREKFHHMVVGVIKEIKAHPKADRLRITLVDVGAQAVEIVCGGSNLEVGQRVFVALPGSKVRWHGEGDLIELKETEIRGAKSIGMICAPAEVGFEKLQGDEHEIWDLTKITQAPAGTPIVEALGLDDTLFDVEITTNRPDCMGIVGLAREGAAAVNADFVWTPKGLPSAGKGIEVSLEAKKLCPRYIAATLTNVKVGPSPWWLQKKLLQSGHRPINNIVDITNYVLQELGQPMHAFDAAKIAGDKIVVRVAKKGEVLKALDGKDYKLSSKHLVIADAEKPLAIAGVMGGLESGTTSATTTVVFEAAAFDAVSIRKTSRDLNLQSDSQLVFEKGLSTEALPAALARAIELAQELAGGTLAGVTDARLAPYKPQSYPVLFKKIRARIGVEITDAEIEAILTRLGFVLTKTGSRVVAQVPSWRDHDIEAEVDLTEEVARLYGYHNLPAVLPVAPPPTTPDDPTLVWEMFIKRSLAAQGFTEFFGLSFIDVKTLEKYALSPKDAVRVLNPLAEDLSHLRPNLMPSLLRDIERNQAHVPAARVFEISRVYTPQENSLPLERYRLVLSEYGITDDAEDAFMRIKGAVEAFAQATALKLSFERVEDATHWHTGRSTRIFATLQGEKKAVGTLGFVNDVYQQTFGILRPVVAVDLDLETLMPHMTRAMSYAAVPEFPSSSRDLSFTAPEHTLFADVVRQAQSASPLITHIALVDIYRGAGVPDGYKSMTLSLTLSASGRTLTSEEIEGTLAAVAKVLEEKFHATLRG